MSGRRLLSGDAGLSLLLAAGGLFWMANAFEYGFWRGFAPLPGFLPFCYGALLFVLSAVILVRALREGPAGEVQHEAPSWKPLLVALVIALTLVGLETVGFVTAVFTALIVMFVGIERLPALRALLVAFTVTAVFHLLLSVWLRVPLPAGPFGI